MVQQGKRIGPTRGDKKRTAASAADRLHLQCTPKVPGFLVCSGRHGRGSPSPLLYSYGTHLGRSGRRAALLSPPFASTSAASGSNRSRPRSTTECAQKPTTQTTGIPCIHGCLGRQGEEGGTRTNFGSRSVEVVQGVHQGQRGSSMSVASHSIEDQLAVYSQAGSPGEDIPDRPNL